jgi:ABC-type branched-subunit amino acid transport system ATPase component
METDIITIQALTKSFSRRIMNSDGGEDDEQYWIIKDLFLNVPRGKVIALIGGNGAGKTTLFNIISGFVKPDSGSIIFKGDGCESELLKMQPHLIAQMGLGRMFQDNHIFPEMSVLDNMLIANSLNSSENPVSALLFKKRLKRDEVKRTEKTAQIFDTFFGKESPFWEKRYVPAGTLSYGQQRLLGLARLFMREYQLLLLDEPSSGVNPEVIEQIKVLIRRFTEQNQTVLLIEHNLDVVQDIADFCCYMDQGRITLMGTPADVIGNEEVRKSYVGF